MIANEIDKQITESIKELRGCSFKTSLPLFTVVPQSPRSNVYRLGEGWVIKYFFAERQRVFGIFDNQTTAMRLADMIIHRFAATRKRSTLRLYNISREQAEKDIANETEIYSTMLRILALLPESAPAPRETQLDRIESLLTKLVNEKEKAQH